MRQPVEPTKGKLTILETGDFRNFSLNPAEINDNKGINLGEFGVVGMSSPVVQPANGTLRAISFNLTIDGDVGYRQARQRAALDGASRSIYSELTWYRSLLYPEATERLGVPSAQTPILLFSFGSLFSAVRVVMKQCNIVVKKWDNELEPELAEIAIELNEVIRRNVLRGDVYIGGNGSF